jgi:hypothetical protein
MTSTQGHAFDPARAAEHYRLALLRIVDMLFAVIGLDETAVLATLPRSTRNYVLRILRPAESAARRLIVIAARGIEVVARSSSEDPFRARDEECTSLSLRHPRLKAEDDARCETSRPTAGIAPNLPLLDTLKRFDFAPRRRYATTAPRIRSLGDAVLPVYLRLPEPAAKPLPSPGDPLDATRLCARMQALKAALNDLDKQAKRLARWQARCDLRRKQPDHKPGRNSPMRPGWPPGHRKRPFHEVDDVLRECHSLAVWAMKAPDTS